MTEITDQQFADEVAALEKELRDGIAEIDTELRVLHTDLDANLAIADKVFTEFTAEIEKGKDDTALGSEEA